MIDSSISKTRVWFITGCSSGLGRALAESVLERGETVVLTARNLQQVEELAANFPNQTLAVKLDVTKPREVREAVKQAITKFGRIDVLVNNAGCKVGGVVEEVSDEEIRYQFETNFFGALETIRAVLPHMRQQQSGHILNISSMACFMAQPGGGLYGSSKLALEGISGSLAYEVAPFGIKVTAVEPGGFRTNFVTRSFIVNDSKIDGYKQFIDEMRQGMLASNGKQLGDPKKAALAMIQVVDSDNPPYRLALGEDAFHTINHALELMKEELYAWKETSVSTAFDTIH